MSSFWTPATEAFLEGISTSHGYYECSVCLGEDIDPDDYKPYTVNGEFVCSECIDSCPLCGERMDDAHMSDSGPSVQYRQWENDGRFSGLTCASCAAAWLIDMWSGDKTFDTWFATKEDIDAVVRAAFPVKEVA